MSDMANKMGPFAHLPSVLTVEEVAELLRVTENNVRKLISEGKIPAVRVGRVLRIYRDELAAVLEGTRVTGDDADDANA